MGFALLKLGGVGGEGYCCSFLGSRGIERVSPETHEFSCLALTAPAAEP